LNRAYRLYLITPTNCTLQERLISILEFYANYKQAEKKPATCFWPVAAPAVTATAGTTATPASNTTAGNATSGGAARAAPACSLSPAAVAKPAEYYHGRDAALKVS
jgi:hypothetical protein